LREPAWNLIGFARLSWRIDHPTNGRIRAVKTKISATIDHDRLAEAQKLTGCANVSAVLNQALEALIVAHLERAHAEGYARIPQDDETIALPDPSIWNSLPWDEDEA
jgi:hypothetical protein